MEAFDIAMNEQGRVTIPAKLRKALKLNANTALMISAEGHKLIIQDRASFEREMTAFFKAQKEKFALTDSEVDTFIAERRLEANRE